MHTVNREAASDVVLEIIQQNRYFLTLFFLWSAVQPSSGQLPLTQPPPKNIAISLVLCVYSASGGICCLFLAECARRWSQYRFVGGTSDVGVPDQAHLQWQGQLRNRRSARRVTLPLEPPQSHRRSSYNEQRNLSPFLHLDDLMCLQ